MGRGRRRTTSSTHWSASQSRILGGKSSWRKDHIADQTFVQGLTTHKNNYDFVTLGTFESMYSTELQKPPGTNFWEWIKSAQFKT